MKPKFPRRSRPNGQQPLDPGPPKRSLGAAVFYFFLVVIGLGLFALAVTKAIPISRSKILLERTSPRQVEGSLSFVIAGVPIFWRSLDGLDHLEDQDYTRNDISTGSSRRRFLGERKIDRMGFMDAQCRTLAWVERAWVLNAESRITDLLKGSDPTFQLVEDISPLGMGSSWAAAKRALFALVILAGGLLFVAGGLGGMVGMLRAKAAVAPQPAAPPQPGTE